MEIRRRLASGGLALLLGSRCLAGAPVDFERISLAQGLSQSVIESIVQDRKGFLWFATEDGLNRYDGYGFTVYRYQAGNERSLSYNDIKTLHEDRAGLLWVGTFEGGLNRFDPATGTFTRYRNDPSNPASLAANTVRAVLEDRAGNLWIGTQGGGLDRLDRETGTFAHHRFDPARESSLPHDDVRAILEDGGGALWIGTYGGGLARYDREKGTFTRYRSDPADPGSLSHDLVTALFEDRRGTLWIGTYGGGVNALDRETGRFRRFRAAGGRTLPSDLVRALFEGDSGALWIATDGGGLARLDRETGRVEGWRNDPLSPLSLSTDRVWSLLEDSSGILWIGTYGGGLNKLAVRRKRFAHFRKEPGNRNSINHNIVWSIHEDRDEVLWIGTDAGGLNRLDRRTGEVRFYVHDPRDPRSLSHNAVRVVFGDRSGVLWLGTNGGGLNRFDRATETFHRFRHDPSRADSLAHDEIRTIYEDREGNLWVGTYGGGLDLLDRRTGRFLHHRHDPATPRSLPSDFVRAIFEDTEGTLWIGTNGGGLARFDRATGGFTRFTEADGLASDSTYGFLEDETGRLWISTTRGLSCFDPRTSSFHNYDTRDGLQSNEFNGGSVFRSSRGEMFFGGINGFNAFFPAEIVLDRKPPTVVLTDLMLFNRSVRVGEAVRGRVILERPLAYTDAVTLSWRDDVAAVEFAALHYAAPEKNRYAYRLEGFSDIWIPARADRRVATFTGLPPGRYVLRVKAANADGVWNDDGTALRITVTPPAWATWWFRLPALALLSGLAVVAARRRLRNVRFAAALKAAHDAQMALLPQEDPRVPGFEVTGICLPTYEVGGDFFDYLRPDGEESALWIAVGDVSGKGMRAAMAAAMSSGMVRAHAGGRAELPDVVTAVSRALHGKLERHMFTALCLASLDARTRELTVVNAGLCEPLRKSGGATAFLESLSPSFPLGAFPATAYRGRTVTLRPGDVVVFYTDGVPEALDRHGAQYGYETLAALVRRLDTGALSAHEIRDEIVREVGRFSGGRRPEDDVALVVVKAI